MQDVICQIIRHAFSGGPALVLPPDVSAKDVYAELQEQAISGLAMLPGSLADACADARLATGMLNADLRRRALAGHLLDVQDATLAALAQEGVPAAILKGAAAGMYYPDATLRAYGDIDVMVPPTQLEVAHAALVAAGYEATDDGFECDHHTGLTKDGVHVELYWTPNGIPTGEPGRRLEALFERELESGGTQAACVAGHEFRAFTPMLNGVVLLLHARRHLSEGGLGFRQIIDWMLFARRYLTGAGWEEFALLLCDAQLERTACCLTRFCQLYLGMPQEGFAWCADVEEGVCTDLLAYVMRAGNFGHKMQAPDGGKSAAIALARARNPVQFLRNMQQAGLMRWKAAHAHAALRPFAWLYQGCRYVHLALTRPNAVARMRSDVAEAAWRRKLAEELGLYDR